ncbi:MAG: anti-sigma factor antagonist [Solirubrobacteraceae bacterium]|jgi:anti-anti-sigma factor|nr:anti-sigma factor antagonist [Solirubrobacteraceae bacterium]
MEIRTTQDGGAARMEVIGELDIGTGPQLEDAVSRALVNGSRDVVVDLAGTTFLDSSGLGSLIRAARSVDATQGTMTVLSPPGSEARVVIEMSRTGDVVGLQEA